MEFNIESPWWKLAIVLGLLGMREFVRLLSPREVKVGGGAGAGANSDSSETSKWLIETLDSATIAIGLVLFVIQPFILQAFFIPSGSMEDTLRISDRLLVSRLIYRLEDPHFQDVVVFEAPEAAAQPPHTDFIKRCMGTPGDVVEMRNGKFYRKGKLDSEVKFVKEPYKLWNGPTISYDMKIVEGAVYSREYYAPNQPGAWSKNGLVVPDADQTLIEKAKPGPVPAGHLLMLGDHRSNSNDGHVWGFTPRENVVGKAICVFWPPTRLGLVDGLSFHPRAPQQPVSTENMIPVQ